MGVCAVDCRHLRRPATDKPVEGDVPVVYHQRHRPCADQPHDEADDDGARGDSQLAGACRVGSRGHLACRGRLRRMGNRVADHCARHRQIGLSVDDNRLASAHGVQHGVAAVGVFRWQRSDGVLFSQHIVAQRLLVYHRCLLQPCQTRMLHAGRQMEQDGHTIDSTDTDGVVPARAQRLSGRQGAVAARHAQDEPLHRLSGVSSAAVAHNMRRTDIPYPFWHEVG